jgi:VIT1/CCC1 family predicted Fe2+/Mn2+ transporter
MNIAHNGRGVDCMAQEGNTNILSTEPQEKRSALAQVENIQKTTVRQEIADIFKAIGRNDASSHDFLLRVVQPGLAGLMDGSVSTLAPIFATAFASHEPWLAFLVGMASATGAGISMAFSEALSDDGVLTGRGSPIVRGAITGIMTFFGGALHTLPFLISHIQIALLTAYIVVAFELVLIAAIRHRYFGTSWLLSIVQVVGGGALVFVAAMIFGNA